MRRYIKDIFTGKYKWVESTGERTIYAVHRQPGSTDKAASDKRINIISDIDPYRSVITGERIAGRRQHKEHLAQHDCVEVGNEKPKLNRPKQSTLNEVKADVAQVMREKGVIG